MGKVANITIKIGTDCYHRKAVTIPGENIELTAAMSLDMANTEELPRILHQIQLNNQLREEDTHFIPPRMEDGILKVAVRVSQGEVVEAVVQTEKPVVLGPEPQSEEVKHAKVEEIDVGFEGEKVLAVEGEMSSVSDAGESDTQGGSANIGEEEVSVKEIVANESREKLAKAIKSDSTLAAARVLADQLTEGYHWTEGLFFRTRLNVLGDKIEQLCLPVNYRARY